MKLYPAIDLKHNRCVRLSQGKFDQEKVYDQDPFKVAKRWLDEGATFLHIIDLDGAKDNDMINLPAIKNINTLSIPMQVGGGIRSLKRIETLLKEGINRVIIGTMALDNMAMLKTALKRFPGQIIVSIDAKKGKVLSHGWQKDTNISALNLASTLENIGIKTIIYTDIEKDGMLKGPNLEAYKTLVEKTNLEIIAAGGITTLDDLKSLEAIGVFGAIIGKALYEEKIDLKEALQCLQDASSRA